MPFFHQSLQLFYKCHSVMISFSASVSFIKALESQQNHYNCDFPHSQLHKFAWGKIEQNAPDVYYLLSKMHFVKDALDNLLRKHKNGEGNLTSQEVACQWVQQNREAWLPWLPPGSLGKIPVYLGGMFPLSASEDAVWSRPGILQGKIFFEGRGVLLTKVHVYKIPI